MKKNNKKGIFSNKNGGVEFSINKLITYNVPVLTFKEKIEPIFNTNQTIMDQLYRYGVTVNTGFATLKDNFSTITEIANNNNLIAREVSYDFSNQPISATLNSATDLLQLNQDVLGSSLNRISYVNKNIPFNKTNFVGDLGILNDISLDYLKDSFAKSSVIDLVSPNSEIDTIKERLEKLESKVEKLNEEKAESKLSDISERVYLLLKETDEDMANCFKGGINNLLSGENTDMVGQVSESFTRVIENLPVLLVPEAKSIKTDKKIQKIWALEKYLNIKEGTGKTNSIVKQQGAYYDVLSQIRHRNTEEYKLYNSNNKLFRALIIQIEAYIYSLLIINK